MEAVEIITLQPGDKRLGRDLPDGRRWPEIDLNGQPIEKPYATIRHLNTEFFVVIPHRWVGGVRLAAQTPTLRVADAEEAPVRGGTKAKADADR